MQTPSPPLRTAAALAGTALLGALASFTVQVGAQTSAETMLMNTAVDDLERLRSYLLIKARDLAGKEIDLDRRLAQLEARIATLEGSPRRPDQPLVVGAPFTVVDEARRVILEVKGNAGGGELTLGNVGTATVTLRTSLTTGSVSALGKNQPEARLMSGNGQAGVEVNESETTLTFLGRASLEVEDDLEEDVSVLMVNNTVGQPIVAVSAQSDGGHVQVLDENGENVGAELLASSSNGGTLRVSDASGATVAGVIATGNGGRVVVTGAGGGRTVASLYAGAGGQLRLWDAAGTTRVIADSNSDGNSQLSVLGTRGSATLNAADAASPMLEIADATGNPYVRAGISTDGVGVVMAGPAGNGTAGTMGGGMTPASQIVGKK